MTSSTARSRRSGTFGDKGLIVADYVLTRVTVHHPAAPEVTLLVASLGFYSWWTPAQLPLLLGSIVFNFLIAHFVVILLGSFVTRCFLGLGITVSIGLTSNAFYLLVLILLVILFLCDFIIVILLLLI